MAKATPKTDKVTGTTATEDAKASLAETKEERAKRIKLENQKTMKKAKARLNKFKTEEAFTKLPKDVQEAITRVIGKVGGGAGGMQSIVLTKLAPLFKKVGDAVGELDIFKATKMGRGEIRKNVRETLKKADPADRIWFEFDKDKEAWVFIGKGEAQPKAWRGKAID